MPKFRHFQCYYMLYQHFKNPLLGVLYHNGETDTIILANHIVYQEVNTFIGLSC